MSKVCIVVNFIASSEQSLYCCKFHCIIWATFV